MSEHGVELEVGASPAVVYDLLTDVSRMARWSPEVTSCRWVRGAAGPSAGARFRGWSRNGWRRWSTLSTVTEATRPAVFQWKVTFIGMRVATWRYSFESLAGDRTLVREAVVDERGQLIRRLSPYITGSPDRQTRNDETMNVTLRRLKQAAEEVAARS